MQRHAQLAADTLAYGAHFAGRRLGILYSAPGDGKSFLALSWALPVVLGKAWLGKHAVIQGRVLYIYAEGTTGLPNRIKALTTYYQWETPSNLQFITEAVNFHEPEDFKRLCATINTMEEPPIFIIIDTLARCLSGGDDNSAKEISEFVGRIDKIRQGTGAFVLVIHHKVSVS